MPGFDGTGPAGQGPMTGRGMGPCSGNAGYGQRFGGRRGFGFRQWFSPKNNLRDLEEEKSSLEQTLQTIKEEISALKSNKE
jgi:hypothetical protein